MQIKIKLVHELNHKKHTSMYVSPQPKLGKSHYSLLYIHFVNDHEDYNKMIKKIQEPEMGSLKNFPSYEFCYIANL